MYLKEIFSGTLHAVYGQDVNIKSPAVHSSLIGDDCLFFAHNGVNTSAKDTVLKAVNNGAAAVCTDDVEVLSILKGIVPVVYVPDSRYAESYAADKLYAVGDRPKIVGVTGTNGKTSVCHMLYRAFSYLEKPSSYTGSLGTDTEGFEHILKNTTPPPSIYRKIVSTAAESGKEYVFSEISSEGILQHRASHIPFHALVFTNLTPEHLNTHGTMENYYLAKKSIFEENECFYIINTDDSYGRRLFDETDGVKISYGTDENCDIVLSGYSEDISGSRFALNIHGQSITVTSSLYGIFNAYNSAAVGAVMYVEGFSSQEIQDALVYALAEPVKGRMERFIYGNADIFVDYSHTPDSLQKALETLKGIGKGKIITVFGCGGDRDRSKRSEMGKIACMYSDSVILTEDNSRSEDTMDIINEIYTGCDENITKIYPDRRQAITVAAEMLGCGDILLIAGRGAEECLTSKDGKIRFSDRGYAEYLCLRKDN